jgi:hypothetical protein
VRSASRVERASPWAGAVENGGPGGSGAVVVVGAVVAAGSVVVTSTVETTVVTFASVVSSSSPPQAAGTEHCNGDSREDEADSPHDDSIARGSTPGIRADADPACGLLLAARIR